MRTLLKHIERKHPSKLKSVRNGGSNVGKSNLCKLLYRPNVISIQTWLSSMTHCPYIFSIVHNDDVRMHIWCNKLSLNTLIKIYMSIITTRVEANMYRILPDKFALVFDGHMMSEAY